VQLWAPADQRAALRALGLPLQIVVRFVSLRLSTGELEVLVTTLLNETIYPTADFRPPDIPLVFQCVGCVA